MSKPSPLDAASTSFERDLAEVVRSGDHFRLIFETTYQFIGLLDTQGMMLEVNRSALDWVHTRRENVVGQPVWTTPWWVNAGDAVLERLKAAVADARSGAFVRYDVTLPSVDGVAHTFDFSLMPIADADGQVVLLVAEGRDITEQKRLEQALREVNQQLQLAQEQARQLAITDELTGLYNRRGFFLMAEQQKRAALRTQARGLLMFVDIDGLKQANDSFGHDVGDALIRAAARTLAHAFRNSDLVARLGGDEFAVLALPSPGDVTATLAERVASHVEAFNSGTTLPLPLRLSIGWHEFAWTEDLALDMLVARADADMYRHKRSRRGTASGETSAS
jgi:diguanylate cyclase (GGDEF)-like protein/PAS domain S-box-containing protein